MGSLVEETINKLVRDCINRILAIDDFAIKANQNAASPSGSYATVNITSIIPIGWDDSTYSDGSTEGELNQQIIGRRDILITINTFRENAKNNAESIRTGFIRDSILQLLDAGNVGLGERKQVLGATQALQANHEQRATFSLTLSTVVSDSDIIGTIDTFNIGGEYHARGLITNLNIEV